MDGSLPRDFVPWVYSRGICTGRSKCWSSLSSQRLFGYCCCYCPIEIIVHGYTWLTELTNREVRLKGKSLLLNWTRFHPTAVCCVRGIHKTSYWIIVLQGALPVTVTCLTYNLPSSRSWCTLWLKNFWTLYVQRSNRQQRNDLEQAAALRLKRRKKRRKTPLVVMKKPAWLREGVT